MMRCLEGDGPGRAVAERSGADIGPAEAIEGGRCGVESRKKLNGIDAVERSVARMLRRGLKQTP